MGSYADIPESIDHATATTTVSFRCTPREAELLKKWLPGMRPGRPYSYEKLSARISAIVFPLAIENRDSTVATEAKYR